MAARERLTASEARRLALGAQGMADPRPTGRVDRRHFQRVLDRVGLIQIDSVNVLVRSQELPLFARLGPHPRTMIDDAAARGELFEYWVHEASHVPTAHYHLHRWRMAMPHRWKPLRGVVAERPEFVEDGDLQQRQGPKGAWWDWDDGKIALEALFHAGRLSARRRPSDFARMYDITERVIPPDALVRPVPPEPEARKELLVLAARHHGVGTLADLADYHRQKPTVCKPLVAELVEDGRLLEVAVEGWDRPAYVLPDARIPRRVSARALLSPFDPIVWRRERAERLFGFHYRIEIYTPKPKRQYGYYVLPFLLGDRLVGRVDLKADRAAGRLVVQAAWAEPGIDEFDAAHELYEELLLMAGWLGLERIELAGRGDLNPALARVVDRRAPSAASA
jgi:uncharacterized protein YcaQ